MTVMPMVRGDETIGTLNVVRRNPGALSEKQLGLLRTFANQAVIAIENTRLFSELSFAAAADRHCRRPEGHQQFARRVRTSVQCDAC